MQQARNLARRTPLPRRETARLVDVGTIVLAACSIVYELLLGQALAAFLGNTVLRFSVTIGLYMLSMGIGAVLVRGRLLRSPIVSLQVVELALTVCGAAALPLLFAMDAVTGSATTVSWLGHALVVAIGILTGTEIPLLIAIRKRLGGHAVTRVLTWDYVGAFAGTLAFAFWFYPTVGLVGTALLVALANAAVGVGLYRLANGVTEEREGTFSVLLLTQAVLLVALVACLAQSDAIEEACIQAYLGGAV